MSKPDVVRSDHPGLFAGSVLSFLLEHEAEHCLLIGIVGILQDDPGRFDAPPYLAAAVRDGTVEGVAIRTPPWPLALSRWADHDALDALVSDLVASDASIPGVSGPVDVASAFVERWRIWTGAVATKTMAQRIYQLNALTPAPPTSGTLRRATGADRSLVIEWAMAFHAETFSTNPTDPRQVERSIDARLRGPNSGVWLWEDGAPVSMVGCGGPTPHGIRIGPVYTPTSLRGRGYATAATAAVSQILLDEGRRFCFLFTDLANPTSNSIYQRIGYRPIADNDLWRFGAG